MAKNFKIYDKAMNISVHGRVHFQLYFSDHIWAEHKIWWIGRENYEEKIRELKNKTALGSIKTEKNLKVSYWREKSFYFGFHHSVGLKLVVTFQISFHQWREHTSKHNYQ